MRARVFGIIAAAFVIVSVQAADAADRVALVIGNAKYEHSGNLRNTANDAEAMGASLKRLGFDVEVALDKDFAGLRRTLSDFRREAARSKVAVVFYAGHGIEVDKQNYLIPVDARLKSDGDVDFEAISLDLVLRAVEGASRFRMVILDACRDNPFLNTMTRQVASRSIGRGLARVEPTGETLVAFAAKEGTTADDGDGPHSPYTTALLSKLQEPGLEVGLLFRKVRDDVMAATGGEQVPFVYGSLSAEAFYFNAPKDTPKIAEDGATPPAGEEGGVDATAVETAFWRAAEATGTKEGFESYLQSYPNGVFAEAAKIWLKSFEDEETKIAALDKSEGTGDGTDVATPNVPPILECDKLAADPHDSGRVTVGVKYDEIETKRAIPACREAYREYPDSPRIAYQLARSLNREGQHDEARRLFEEMADAKYAPAMDQFGVMLALGSGGNPDYRRAMRLFEDAAAEGSADAVYHIGLLYHNGMGVRRDHAKAAEYYERAIAQADHPSALSNLGTLYARGLGVPKDAGRAVELYRRAAEQGHVIAMSNLATAYRDGVGVKRDYDKAIEYFKKSAKAGGSSAMYGLAVIYHQGKGTRRDMRQAADWMFQALKSGEDFAIKEMLDNARAWNDQFRRELQSRMRDEGVYTGAIDGQFGPGTQRAIKALANVQN